MQTVPFFQTMSSNQAHDLENNAELTAIQEAYGRKQKNL
jgi:hypothetical protein